MRIITYNLRAGGSGQVHWGKVIDEFDPDVLLVQESYAPERHLPPLLHGERHRAAFWRVVSGRKWGSGVYVKEHNARPLELPDLHGHVVGVEVDQAAFAICDGRPLRIFSVHAPHRGSYQQAVHAALDMIESNREECDLVIGGDFNLTVGERLATEELKSSKADLAILARLRDDFGLVSSWQAANAGVPLPQTLRWVTDKAKAYHCDGIFIPQRWTCRLTSCKVITGPQWDAMSDHNPVMVEID